MAGGREDGPDEESPLPPAIAPLVQAIRRTP